MRVTRVIIYEGEESWLIEQMKKSLADGSYHYRGRMKLTSIFDADASSELQKSVIREDHLDETPN